MKVLKWLDDHLEVSISMLLLAVMTVVLFVQVIMRRGFNNSLVWSEELARYIFIWLVYLGISYGAKQIRHIKIEGALLMFPKFLRPYIILIGDLLFLAYAIIIIYTGIDLVQRQMMLNQVSPALSIPMSIVYAAPVVGFAFTAIRQIQTLCTHNIQIIKNPALLDKEAED